MAPHSLQTPARKDQTVVPVAQTPDSAVSLNLSIGIACCFRKNFYSFFFRRFLTCMSRCFPVEQLTGPHSHPHPLMPLSLAKETLHRCNVPFLTISFDGLEGNVKNNDNEQANAVEQPRTPACHKSNNCRWCSSWSGLFRDLPACGEQEPGFFDFGCVFPTFLVADNIIFLAQPGKEPCGKAHPQRSCGFRGD